MDNEWYDNRHWRRDSNGYWVDGKHIYQHVYVYEKLTGCKVFPWQVVHHMDNDRSNNTAENLVCMTRSDHMYLHSKTRSPETRRRLSESHKGKLASEETKSKMAKTRRKAGLKKSNTSGFKGVSWDKHREKWMARIQVGNNYPVLGLFDSKEEAAHAYDTAARFYFGDDAYQNFRKDNLEADRAS